MDRESPSLTSYKTSFHMIEEPTDHLEKRKAINQVSGMPHRGWVTEPG